MGWGKKDKRQVKSAIDRFGVDYGIVISNKTHYIKREDDVIFIPPRTFSFI